MSNPFDSKTLKELKVGTHNYKYYSIRDLGDKRLGESFAS
jgi:hypothetical protein